MPNVLYIHCLIDTPLMHGVISCLQPHGEAVFGTPSSQLPCLSQSIFSPQARVTRKPKLYDYIINPSPQLLGSAGQDQRRPFTFLDVFDVICSALLTAIAQYVPPEAFK
jgi:hypothetical protein